jgi:hypothetical protein
MNNERNQREKPRILAITSVRGFGRMSDFLLLIVGRGEIARRSVSEGIVRWTAMPNAVYIVRYDE